MSNGVQEFIDSTTADVFNPEIWSKESLLTNAGRLRLTSTWTDRNLCALVWAFLTGWLRRHRVIVQAGLRFSHLKKRQRIPPKSCP